MKAYGRSCPCGAVRTDSQIGLEQSPAEYVAQMVEVFRGVRRVLHPSGTVWLNLGDSYAGSWGSQGHRETPATISRNQIANHPKRESHAGTIRQAGLKPKDLMMIPHRVAIALQDDGWWVRQDLVWSKAAPMPESVTDRCTKSHEYVFLLAKSERYFFDAAAIAEASGGKIGGRFGTYPDGALGNDSERDRPQDTGSRNKRSVWHLGPEPLAMAHFAVMPTKLVEPCILAGTSARGCCPTCFAPWQRLVEKTRTFESGSGRSGNLPQGKNGPALQGGGETLDIRMGPTVSVETTGWEPTCSCDAGTPVPCTVLDPFAGSGTVLRIATKHRRHAVGIELNGDYVALCHKRLASVPVTLPMEEAI